MIIYLCFLWTYLASLLQDISWLNILDAFDKTWYEWSFIIDWEKVTKCQFPIKLVHDYSINYFFTRLKWHKKPSNSKSELTLSNSYSWYIYIFRANKIVGEEWYWVAFLSVTTNSFRFIQPAPSFLAYSYNAWTACISPHILKHSAILLFY